jgi:hypothetical protein
MKKEKPGICPAFLIENENLSPDGFRIIAKGSAADPFYSIAFTVNSKLMKVVIRPSHGNLDDVAQVGDRAVAACARVEIVIPRSPRDLRRPSRWA